MAVAVCFRLPSMRLSPGPAPLSWGHDGPRTANPAAHPAASCHWPRLLTGGWCPQRAPPFRSIQLAPFVIIVLCFSCALFLEPVAHSFLPSCVFLRPAPTASTTAPGKMMTLLPRPPAILPRPVFVLLRPSRISTTSSTVPGSPSRMPRLPRVRSRALTCHHVRRPLC